MKRIIAKTGICFLLITFFFTGCTNTQKETEREFLTGTESSATCEITFLDTGKSDGICIRIDDMSILNDTAEADDYLKIQKWIDENAKEKIDYMIISHFDKDHIGSAAKIIQNNKVDCVLLPDYWGDSKEYQDMMNAIASSETQKKVLDENYEIKTENGSILIMPASEKNYDDENNYSMITQITYKDTAFLLMGDALKKRCEEFKDNTELTKGKYQLIKMPHHGEYNKKLKSIIETVKPEYAIILEDENQERVDKKLVTELKKSNCNIYYSFNGNITAISDGKTVQVEQHK